MSQSRLLPFYISPIFHSYFEVFFIYILIHSLCSVMKVEGILCCKFSIPHCSVLGM